MAITNTRITGVRAIPTWEMTEVELARVFAAHHGFTTTAADGGWIRRPDGQVVCQGWVAFAAMLTRRGWIKVGTGINWRQAGENPRLPRFTRKEA